MFSSAAQASLRDKGNGKKNLLKSLSGREASFLFYRQLKNAVSRFYLL
jgi:hypothetical protein